MLLAAARDERDRAASAPAHSIFLVEPLAPDRTRVVTRTKVADVPRWRQVFQLLRSGALWRRTRGKYEGDARRDPLASGDFMKEDIFVCEQQQRSLRSPRLEHGPSARIGEAAVRRHQEIVLEWLGEAGAEPPAGRGGGAGGRVRLGRAPSGSAGL